MSNCVRLANETVSGLAAATTYKGKRYAVTGRTCRAKSLCWRMATSTHTSTEKWLCLPVFVMIRTCGRWRWVALSLILGMSWCKDLGIPALQLRDFVPLLS